MSFVVTIDQFDGPLDLMIHLIKEKELDIFNLDIAVLADQYISYIHQMEKLHLDIASEYLAELAGLIEYKSRHLLPAKESELEDGYEPDNEEQLVKRLLEYQKFKEVSNKFEQLYQDRQLLHDKDQSELAGNWIKVDENYQNGSPYDLIRAMKRVLNRYTLTNPYEVSIATQRMSVEERQQQLTDKINSYPENEVFELSRLMEGCHDVYDVVVTFLAILTMVNQSLLNYTVRKENVYFKKGVNHE